MKCTFIWCQTPITAMMTTAVGIVGTMTISPFSPTYTMPQDSVIGGTAVTTPYTTSPYSLSEDGTSGPRSPKQFIPPTNTPQSPPSDAELPPGHTVRKGGPTPDYPNGYWRQYNQKGQPVDPSTGKPPSDAKTTPEVRSRTHVP